MMYQRPLCYCAAFILSVALRSQSFAQKTEKKHAQSKVAYFAGGCFWYLVIAACPLALAQTDISPAPLQLLSSQMQGPEIHEFSTNR